MSPRCYLTLLEAFYNNIEGNGILKYEKDDSFGFMAAVEYLVQSYQQKLQIFCVFMVACHINS